MNYRLEKYKSLSVAILLHGLLLVILAMIYVLPHLDNRWLELEYLFPQSSATQLEDIDKPELLKFDSHSNIHNKSVNSQEAATNPSISHTETERTSSGADPIALPVMQSQKEPSELVQLPVNPGLKGILRNLTSGNNAASSLNVSVEGGELIPSVPGGLKHTLGEPGWVVLSFKLDTSARVIRNSIIPVQQSNNRFVEEAKAVLLKCSFQFKGQPESGKAYRVRVNFQ